MKFPSTKRINGCFLIGAAAFGCVYIGMLLALDQHNMERLTHELHTPSLELVSHGRSPRSSKLSSANATYPRIDGGASTRNGTRTRDQRSVSPKKAMLLSSLDYFACCGAGHRLSKLVDAHVLAKNHLNFGLRVFFGFCDRQEVYSYLFGPQPLSELQHIHSYELQLKIQNDVPGFQKITRNGPDSACPCPVDRWKEDQFFFEGLRNRFRGKGMVNQFLQDQLSADDHTVIGMHVRAGNGEVGDFTGKNRAISDPLWAESMAERLVEMTTNWKIPPILFLATDTASMVTTFRQLLQHRMPVVSVSQARPKQGEGVMFGENYHNLNEEDRCLDGWQAAFTDMMILSHADVVVSARPSSFTQSLPMTLVLATPQSTRKVPRSYCEVNPSATAMQCFETLQDWCCNGTTSFSLRGIQNYEYRRMPESDFDMKQLEAQIAIRPRKARECIPTPKYTQRKCLPYFMPDKENVEEEGRMVFLPSDNATAKVPD